jgi:hypothetical protein
MLCSRFKGIYLSIYIPNFCSGTILSIKCFMFATIHMHVWQIQVLRKVTGQQRARGQGPASRPPGARPCHGTVRPLRASTRR